MGLSRPDIMGLEDGQCSRKAAFEMNSTNEPTDQQTNKDSILFFIFIIFWPLIFYSRRVIKNDTMVTSSNSFSPQLIMFCFFFAIRFNFFFNKV